MTTLPEGLRSAGLSNADPEPLEILEERRRRAVRQLREALSCAAVHASSTVVHARGVAGHLRAQCGRPARLAFGGLALAALLVVTSLVHYVYFNRNGMPSLDAFVRFEPTTIGEVHDARGTVLIELAREYRRVVSYDEVPPILRHAILAAEDKNFFSHSGVDYASLPRVVHKAVGHTLAAWWKGGQGVRFPQGGSTLTQQLVRSYFLHEETGRENGDSLLQPGFRLRLVSAFLGVRAANKLYRKLEEARLSLWIEEELARRYGSRAQAKREIFARYASFIYLGHSRYGFAAASEYYFDRPLSTYTDEKDAGRAALLAGIPKSPRAYVPVVGDPRPLRRRNEILALMAKNGYIPQALARRSQAEPVLRAARSAAETHAPATIGSVFGELRRHGAGRFSISDLVEGRILVRTTVDGRVQTIVNEALETGLALYEQRHAKAKGLIQGSVVVLANADAAVLAEAGGRQVYGDRATRYSDLNRVTGSLRQPGSVWKPLVYLTAFREGLDLASMVPDEPIGVPTGSDGGTKWIGNYDHEFKGPIPLRQALAESRNAVAVWVAREIGIGKVNHTAKALGISTPLQPYITTALGASEVRLLELAGVYRALASGLLAEPHVVSRVTDGSGKVLYEAPRAIRDIRSLGISTAELLQIQEGLRGVVRLPTGTAHGLTGGGFAIPVMGKTGTTSDFRDALFVGSTYGPRGITVAVRIGFDDNRTLGNRETGGRAAMPIFREIMQRVYEDQLVGKPPRFPRQIEEGINSYRETQVLLQAERDPSGPDPSLVLPSAGLAAAAAPGGSHPALMSAPPR